LLAGDGRFLSSCDSECVAKCAQEEKRFAITCHYRLVSHPFHGKLAGAELSLFSSSSTAAFTLESILVPEDCNPFIPCFKTSESAPK
jgi:hypothetical protein